MSAARHLSDTEFGGYRPAKEEGRSAQEWLTTNEGHDWMDESIFMGSANHGGFYSIKEDKHKPAWDKSHVAANSESNDLDDWHG